VCLTVSKTSRAGWAHLRNDNPDLLPGENWRCPYLRGPHLRLDCNGRWEAIRQSWTASGSDLTGTRAASMFGVLAAGYNTDSVRTRYSELFATYSYSMGSICTRLQLNTSWRCMLHILYQSAESASFFTAALIPYEYT
jgi:hypothetical protein